MARIFSYPQAQVTSPSLINLTKIVVKPNVNEMSSYNLNIKIVEDK